MKKTLFTALTVTLILATVFCLPACDMLGNFNATEDTTNDTSEPVIFEFETNGDGTCKVSITKEAEGAVTIPSTSPDGDKVTQIHRAYYNRNITDVIIPETVTNIDQYAFDSCSNLKNVTIPKSVTQIGYAAFYDCTKLENVYITDLKAWFDASFTFSGGSHDGGGRGQYAANPMVYAQNMYLNGKLVTELVIPDGVTSIFDTAFSNCKNITAVTVPETVTSIGTDAFNGCINLTSINIPDSVTSIGIYAFAGCDVLQYNEYSNAYYLGNNENPHLVLVKAKDTSIEQCSINSSARFILENAFKNCHSLSGVTFENPNGWTVLGDEVKLANPEWAKTLLVADYHQYVYNVWTRN